MSAKKASTRSSIIFPAMLRAGHSGTDYSP
jgi:hypothetical protein